MSNQSEESDFEEVLELPDWVQDKLNESVNLRKNLCREIVNKEQAIVKINEHLANNTHPVSIIPNVKLHVSEKYQQTANQKVEELNKEYGNQILALLKSVREKELKDLKQKQQAVSSKLRQELRHTLQRMKDTSLYDGDIDEDVNTYVRVYRYENRKGELAYRKAMFFKDLQRKERLAKSAEAEAQRKADMEMEDPMEKIRNELSEIRSHLQRIKSSRQNQKGPTDSRQTNNRNNHRQSSRKSNKNNNSGKGGGRQTQRQKNSPTHPNQNNGQKNGRGGGSRKHRPPSTNTTNQSGSNPKRFRPKRN